jgi:hypothetical protein
MTPTPMTDDELTDLLHEAATHFIDVGDEFEFSDILKHMGVSAASTPMPRVTKPSPHNRYERRHLSARYQSSQAPLVGRGPWVQVGSSGIGVAKAFAAGLSLSR